MEQRKTISEARPVYYGLKAFSDNASSGVFHGFFGQQGGVSKGVYSSLNCGFGSDDEAESVVVNRALIAGEVGIVPENLVTAYQEHGSTCVQVTERWAPANAPKADAMVTDVPGVALGILTADCAPVFFMAENDAGQPIIGAAHAGWRGALGGVLEATVEAMGRLGANPEDVKACIGPCISKSSYEVGAEFFDEFMSESEENERFFMAARKDGCFMFDLAGYCANRLQVAGLANVYIKDLDTYFNEHDFFSCRRALHRNERDYGRQISVIAIKI